MRLLSVELEVRKNALDPGCTLEDLKCKFPLFL